MTTKQILWNVYESQNSVSGRHNSILCEGNNRKTLDGHRATRSFVLKDQSLEGALNGSYNLGG